MLSKQKSQQYRLLKHLQARAGKWCGRLYRNGRFGIVHSRVSGLRAKGHVIECKRFGEDYRYRLVEARG